MIHKLAVGVLKMSIGYQINASSFRPLLKNRIQGCNHVYPFNTYRCLAIKRVQVVFSAVGIKLTRSSHIRRTVKLLFLDIPNTSSVLLT